MTDIKLKDPVADGFWSGLGLIVSGLITVLIFMVLYVFYLTFLI